MCGHSTQERTLPGTWYTPELQKAVEKGYQILKIHEVWHFTPENRRVGLFKDYVNTWLKLKQESAGRWKCYGFLFSSLARRTLCKNCRRNEQECPAMYSNEARPELV